MFCRHSTIKLNNECKQHYKKAILTSIFHRNAQLYWTERCATHGLQKCTVALSEALLQAFHHISLLRSYLCCVQGMHDARRGSNTFVTSDYATHYQKQCSQCSKLLMLVNVTNKPAHPDTTRVQTASLNGISGAYTSIAVKHLHKNTKVVTIGKKTTGQCNWKWHSSKCCSAFMAFIFTWNLANKQRYTQWSDFVHPSLVISAAVGVRTSFKEIAISHGARVDYLAH